MFHATRAAVLLMALACAATTRADDLTGIKLNGHEIGNVWRFCSVSGRATAAILQCFHEQIDKLGHAKTLERSNQQMEALTRKELDVPNDASR